MNKILTPKEFELLLLTVMDTHSDFPTFKESKRKLFEAYGDLHTAWSTRYILPGVPVTNDLPEEIRSLREQNEQLKMEVANLGVAVDAEFKKWEK